MKTPFRDIISFALLVFGILLILYLFEVINITYLVLLGISFIVYSVPGVFFSLKKGYRLILVISTAIFFVGVLFLTKQIYHLPDSREIYLTSSLFILGACFLILFVENNREKKFFIVSIILLVLAFTSVYIFKLPFLHLFFNKVDLVMLNGWSYLLVLLGLFLLINRKK